MHPIHRFAPSRLLLVGALALLLSSCAVTFVPSDPVDVARPTPPTDVVRPTPTRPDVDRPIAPATLPGDGSIQQFEVTPLTIRPGRAMYFRASFAHAGYVTISAMAPNGRIEVLVRNAPVPPGVQVFLPALDAPPSELVRASAPLGRWVLRAQFARTRTEARYQNLQGYDAWTAAVADDLRGAANASVFETAFEVEER